MLFYINLHYCRSWRDSLIFATLAVSYTGPGRFCALFRCRSGTERACLKICGCFEQREGNSLQKGAVDVLTTQQIKEIIPHRYPFLLVDRILELEPGKRAVGLKNVSANEPFFQGHFPDYPVMPGVLIAEALAQTGAVALLQSEENRGKIGMLAGLDGFRFRGQVTPGDTLRLEVEIVRMKGTIGKGHGTALVDGKVVAEGDIMFAIVDPNA